MRELTAWLAGDAVKGREVQEVRSPYSGEVVSRVARVGRAELEEAAAAAAEARANAARTTPERRAAVLETARTLLAERKDQVAQAIVEEAGKPVTLARLEVDRAGETLLAAAHVARCPEVAARDLSGFSSGSGRLALVKRVPVGPVLAITPFNFPLNLVAHKLAPAVAAGCPVVLKPASQTPSPALLLAEVLFEAGLPAGALSVLPCRAADAETLVPDPRFGLLTFTGSAEVGWGLSRQAGRKRVALELGGNAAVVVEPDAGDLHDVARRIALAATAYAGQSCISVQRILVNRAIAAEMRELLAAAFRAVPAGDPADPRTMCGPMIDAGNAARVLDWVARARAAGAELLAGGEGRGPVVLPTLLANVPADQPVACDEVFGPVAVLSDYADFEEALERVNDSRFGLQAGLFTEDVGKVRRAWDVLEVGGVVQGDTPTWRSDPMPYGGVKDSGTGREGPAWAYREMTEERLLVLR